MTTLLLSGWTQPVDALAHIADTPLLFDYSQYRSASKAIEALRALRPTSVIAWSLGGQLALRALAAGALRTHHLTLIGTPLQFVGADGMGEETFRLFRDSYAQDPERTKQRFHGLIAKGDSRLRDIMGMLGHHPDVTDTARWLPWLDDLAMQTMDVSSLASLPPTLIIHGMKDHIVPPAQGEMLARHISRAQLNRWADAGHAPHLHDAVRLRAEIAAHRQQSEAA
jgi:pimeloyl-ACP methyl ester carboxylesterase